MIYDEITVTNSMIDILLPALLDRIQSVVMMGWTCS